jgi:hypothetical protein
MNLDCVTEVIQYNRTRDGSTCGVWVMQLPLNFPRSIGNF